MLTLVSISKYIPFKASHEIFILKFSSKEICFYNFIHSFNKYLLLYHELGIQDYTGNIFIRGGKCLCLHRSNI